MSPITAYLAQSPGGPTTELTGTSVFFRWQYEIIFYSFFVAFAALFAAGVYGLATRNEVSKKYRPAAMASTLICWVASLAYLILIVQWVRGFVSNATGTLYAAQPGTIVTGLRYADWSVTVPLLAVELLAVCTIARSRVVNLRFAAMASAFLMIITGFLGVIAPFGSGAGTAELLIWGAISTVFFVALYPILLRPVLTTMKSVSPETATSLRNAAILLLSSWGVYPIVYLIPLWASDNSPGWATTIQLAFTATDILAKAGFGVLIHKVAKLRTAEDAAEQWSAVPDTLPAEVWLSGRAALVAGRGGPAGQRRRQRQWRPSRRAGTRGPARASATLIDDVMTGAAYLPSGVRRAVVVRGARA